MLMTQCTHKKCLIYINSDFFDVSLHRIEYYAYILCSMLCQMNNYGSSEKKKQKKNVYSCCCFVFGISANFRIDGRK